SHGARRSRAGSREVSKGIVKRPSSRWRRVPRKSRLARTPAPPRLEARA
ncbi:MAG: hypothetical protein AB7O66_21585, partial [Limisphaerales bacterium]